MANWDYLGLRVKYGFSDPSVRAATEGLGAYLFHGRTVLLVDEATTGAGERIAALAAYEHLAPIVGTRTAGQVICSDLKSVGNDFFVRIPGRAWYTPLRDAGIPTRHIEPSWIESFKLP